MIGWLDLSAGPVLIDTPVPDQAFIIGSTLFGPMAGFLGAVMLAGTVLLGV